MMATTSSTGVQQQIPPPSSASMGGAGGVGGADKVDAKVLVDFHRYNFLVECSEQQQQQPQQQPPPEPPAEEMGGGGGLEAGGAGLVHYNRDVLGQDEEDMKQLDMDREIERRKHDQPYYQQPPGEPYFAPSSRGRGATGGRGRGRARAPAPSAAATPSRRGGGMVKSTAAAAGAWYRLK